MENEVSISKEDYDKYLKHILEDEAVWNSQGAFNKELYELPVKLARDRRVDDAHAIIGEFLSKRSELVKKYEQEHPKEYRLYETDENGNLTGEYEVITGKVCRI